jgi:hypothetical protein
VELPANIVSPPAPGTNNAASASISNTSGTGGLSSTPVQAEKKKKYQLSTSNDPILADLRDLNFAVLGTLLSTMARRLSSDYEVSYDSNKLLILYHNY